MNDRELPRMRLSLRLDARTKWATLWLTGSASYALPDGMRGLASRREPVCLPLRLSGQHVTGGWKWTRTVLPRGQGFWEM
jgi:hypothetical protein